MAAQAEIDELRGNIGDSGQPPAYDDVELNALLDSFGGVEPRARYAALLPLWAEAAGYTNYSAGSVSEDLGAIFKQLKDLLDQAEHDIKYVDILEAEEHRASAPLPTAIPVQVYF